MRKKIENYGLLIMAVVALLLWTAVFQTDTQKLKLYVLDIGQGDAILIMRGTEEMLVDGGPGKKVIEELGEVMPFYDRKIEKVVLTHPDADHLGGLNFVLDSYEIGEVVITGTKAETETYKNWEKKLEEKKISQRKVKKGDELELAGAKFKVLNPEEGAERLNGEINNTSIVLEMNYGSFDALLTGDAEREVWEKLRNDDLKVEVLKVSHHGAENGTSNALLTAVSPEVGLISVGEKNRYGHPKDVVLKLLEKYKVKIYRTDKEGRIEVTTDGEKYWVKTAK